MSLIKVENLTFAYPGSYDNIFEHVNFQIDSDWKLGLVGRNGRGKTTFLNLLCGKYEYSGNIYSSLEFDYFPCEVTSGERMTTEVLQEICPTAEEWEFLREFAPLEVDPEALWRPFSTLSNGERTKVLLAALFLNQEHFLLIDEPTNHLDLRARGIVSDYLNHKKGFILVSHDRSFLDGCVDHILSINRADIQVRRGNFSQWLENREKQEAAEMAANERLTKEIGRLDEAAQRSAGWSDQVEKSKFSRNSGSKVDRGYVGHKSAKMMKRAKSAENRREAAIQEKSSLLKNVETSDRLEIRPLAYHSSVLLRLKDVQIRYGERAVCGPVSLELRQGSRIALDGRNGSGKSSLLKLICQKAGALPASDTDLPPGRAGSGNSSAAFSFTGEVLPGAGLRISYLPQDASFLTGSPADYAEKCGIEERLFFAILRKLGFERVQFEKNMEDYSGGQKKKVLLARSLCEPAHLYIWDEPLNYIDIDSRMQLENLILEYEPTMIFVEHDRMFRERLATEMQEI